ncbi:unnamed protein product [Lymnaea stagnalis]|uniref:Uncharacterized protein n=1 Tax=Lymnaea stagnalis TaxID=6523 RepID=A0AAV2HHX3_LYMST
MRLVLTPSTKIVLGWTAIISIGLFGFTVARDSVIQNRKALMDMKKRIREQARVEGEAELERKFLERLERERKNDITAS